MLKKLLSDFLFSKRSFGDARSESHSCKFCFVCSMLKKLLPDFLFSKRSFGDARSESLLNLGFLFPKKHLFLHFKIKNMQQILGIGSRINHPKHGKGVVTNVTSKMYWVTFIDSGLETINVDEDFEVIEICEDEVDTISFSEVESSLRAILRKWSDASEIVTIADKWKNGKMVLQPQDKNLSNKEIPIDTFFHKIVMLRDRLRVMEQKINASKELAEADKIDLQQYITRCYGSLTTFNVLFKNPSQQFKGETTKE